MVRLAALLLLLGAGGGLVAAASGQESGAAASQFKAWAAQHRKAYSSQAEWAHRYTVWSANVARVAAAQREHPSFQLGVNAHTDLTPAEFRARYLGAPMQPRRHQPQPGRPTTTSATSGWWPRWLQRPSNKPQHWRYENVTAPAAADWRQADPPVLGKVKDQHVNGTPCGSCWAFSAVSIMEIASAMATGKVTLGSEQHLIDCDRKYDHGCEGGGWLNAIQYTIKNKGLARERDYPYTGKDGECRKKLASAKHTLRVDSYEDVPFSNETALVQAVSQTPVIVAICVGPALDLWHAYKGGVFDAPCCENPEEVTLDHGMVVVGYGTERGVPFWVLKNSWGPSWGEGGFMRIRRNHGKAGKCGLASFPAMVFRKPLPDHHPTQAGQQEERLAGGGAVAAT